MPLNCGSVDFDRNQHTAHSHIHVRPLRRASASSAHFGIGSSHARIAASHRSIFHAVSGTSPKCVPPAVIIQRSDEKNGATDRRC